MSGEFGRLTAMHWANFITRYGFFPAAFRVCMALRCNVMKLWQFPKDLLVKNLETSLFSSGPPSPFCSSIPYVPSTNSSNATCSYSCTLSDTTLATRELSSKLKHKWQICFNCSAVQFFTMSMRDLGKAFCSRKVSDVAPVCTFACRTVLKRSLSLHTCDLIAPAEIMLIHY